MRESQKIALGVLFVIGLIVSFIVFVLHIADPGPPPQPRYNEGQYVRSTLSGQRGQVVRTTCWPGNDSCSYMVRFIGLSMTTRTHVIGPDGPVSTEPLSLVEMNDFELIAD